MVRQVFFRCDLQTLFATFPDISDAIESQKKIVKVDHVATSQCPVALMLNAPTQVSDEVATHVMMCKYGLQHIRETVSEDQLIMLPLRHWHTTAVQPLLSSMVPTFDTVGMKEEDVDFSAMLGKGAFQVFRVVNLQPKRRKLVLSPANELRGDHVAVIRYNLDFKKKDDTVISRVSSCLLDDCNTDIELLSIDTLLAIEAQNFKDGILKCDLHDDSLYSFSTSPLPAVCHTESGWYIATCLVNACAFPGPGGTWVPPSDLTPEHMVVLHHLVDHAFVETINSSFRLTSLGFAHLQRSRDTVRRRHIFRPSRVKKLKDYTQFELLDYLQEKGWAFSRFVPYIAPAPIVLDITAPVVDTVFFNKKLQVSRSYLQCLVNNHSLAQKGIVSIMQKQLVKYYDSILDVLKPGASRVALTDDQEWDKSIQDAEDQDNALEMEDESEHDVEGQPDDADDDDALVLDTVEPVQDVDASAAPTNAPEPAPATESINLEPFSRWGGSPFGASR